MTSVSTEVLFYAILKIMSETISNPDGLDENFWGPAPTEEDIATAELEMAERAKKWETNPPKRPAYYQRHPDASEPI